jgi:hypothetical protein
MFFPAISLLVRRFAALQFQIPLAAALVAFVGVTRYFAEFGALSPLAGDRSLLQTVIWLSFIVGQIVHTTVLKRATAPAPN